MLLALRHPRLWLVTGWILVIFAIVANLVPSHDLPKMGGISDKFEHVTGYLVLSLWIGVYPKPFLQYIEKPVNAVVRHVRPTYPIPGMPQAAPATPQRASLKSNE